jgi:thymidylate kinase
MSTRRALLEDLFRRLDQREIPCCVQRNYSELFDDATSDVDLLTLPERVADLLACCEAAANATGHRLVQKTRFVNRSSLFWNGADGFVRIDVDTEKRWQRYHLLTAAEILERRRRLSSFDIPDPCHECVIVLAQVVWQGKLSERYATRLRELDREIRDKDSLAKVFGEAFGVRKNLLAHLSDPNLTARLQSVIRRCALLQPSRAARSFRYLLDDMGRLLVRLKRPPGIVLRSIGAGEADLTDLRNKLAVLFPLKKGFDCAEKAKRTALRKTLFKGGLAIEAWPAVNRPAPIIRQPWLELNRSFAALREPDGTSHFMHTGSGAMRSSPDFASGLAHFICTALAEQLGSRLPTRRGAFVVLVGLDGSGKTTLARNIATRVTSEKSFTGIRYFHWLPSPRQVIESPLPEPGNQQRHQQRAQGIIASTCSAMRVVKNLLRARLAWWLRLRPLLRQGYLVLVDRYFYNYYLDPVSVKFFASTAWLDGLRRFFPRPDAVVTLHAPADVVLRRKQELPEAEVRRQAATLETMKFDAAYVVAADASQPPEELARHTLSEILKAVQ